LTVDQNARDAGGFVGAIAAGVICAALDQDVTRLHHHFTFVHNRDEFA